MSNLNVLPQVSAKPQSSNSDLVPQLKGGKAAETSTEFQTNLNQAQGVENTVANSALSANKKDASEKAAQAMLASGLAQGAQLPNVASQGVNPQNQALQPSSVQTGVKGQVSQLNQQVVTDLNAKANRQPVGQMNAQQMRAQINQLPLNQKTLTPTQQSQVQELNSKLERTLQQADANQASVAKPGSQQMRADSAVQAMSQVMNGVALGEMPSEHAFDLESLEVKDGVSSSDAATELKGRVPSSKLSTTDYLNLRDLSQKTQLQSQAPITRDAISPQGQALKSQSLLSSGVGLKAVTDDQGKTRKGAPLNETAAPVLTLNPQQQGAQIKTIDAPVTTGSNQATVLSHDALHQITNQVNHLSQAKQDGEIKIRLRPDHLGELQMSVRTQGNAVSIQIKAQDGEAKKIIEESLGSLRDSLSSQNLTLGRVDVVSQPSQAAPQDSGMQMDLGQFRQNHDQSFAGQSNDNSARQDRLYDDGVKPANLNTARSINATRARSSGNGNLDLIA